VSDAIADGAVAGRPTVTRVALRVAAVPHGSEMQRRRDWLLVPAVGALVVLAWLVSHYGGYTPASDLGYNLGLAGGIAMLFVFLYPLRKHVRALHSWGATKHWFALHMACGIGGPFLILAHSGFHIGSINAGVALTCMLLVAASGIVGRFIYVRIHHGLYGTKATLRELQGQVGLNSQEVKSKLHFAPRVEEWMTAFESVAVEPPRSLLHGAWLFVAMGSHRRRASRRCRRELARVYREIARERDWEPDKQRRRLATASRLVEAYLSGLQRVAQFSTYERLFSLWHVLHVPLVWMLALSAVAHVVAVHAY